MVLEQADIHMQKNEPWSISYTIYKNSNWVYKTSINT